MTDDSGLPEALIALQRAEDAAAEEAREHASPRELWRPWVEAAAAAENAVAEYATAQGISQDDVRQAVEKAARAE